MTCGRPALLALALATASPRVLGAQGTTATVRVNLPVTDAVSILEVSSSSVDFGTVGFSELTAGVVSAAGPMVRVKSNRPFVVTAAAATATFGPASKPATDAQWSHSSGGPFTGLSLSPATIMSSPTGAQLQQPLFYRMLVTVGSDPPGAYQLGIVFTLTAP